MMTEALRPGRPPIRPAPLSLTPFPQQLGLRLVPGEESLARLFILDRVAQRPTEN